MILTVIRFFFYPSLPQSLLHQLGPRLRGPNRTSSRWLSSDVIFVCDPSLDMAAALLLFMWYRVVLRQTTTKLKSGITHFNLHLTFCISGGKCSHTMPLLNTLHLLSQTGNISFLPSQQLIISIFYLVEKENLQCPLYRSNGVLFSVLFRPTTVFNPLICFP